ncbi:hypothetical protein [Dyadobacter sp. CY323]|uniref:hypothetical protein n=1 Tax=Dyadobacter sp. CY323 TaxID=2907302 RepID=UPI001F446DF6|nr:hypothetical protein [Dyadobacter sp. CY323]MCE6989020.1 hypothetical protein [Dyadobacter sp. CY323]
METWKELEARQQLEVEQTMKARETYFSDLQNAWGGGGNVPIAVAYQAEINDKAHLDWLRGKHFHEAQMHPDCPEFLRNEDYIERQTALREQGANGELYDTHEIKLANDLMADAPVETPEQETERINQTISEAAYQRDQKEEIERLNGQLSPAITPKEQPSMEQFIQQQRAAEQRVMDEARAAKQTEKNIMEELMRQNAQQLTKRQEPER